MRTITDDEEPTMTTRHRHVQKSALTRVPLAAIGLATVLVASCGGDGSVPTPTLSRSPTATRSPTTATEQPAPTRTETGPTSPNRVSPSSSASSASSIAQPPVPTQTPAQTQTQTPTPTPSPARTPTSKPSTATVTATVIPQPTSTAPTSSPAPSPTATLQPTAGDEAQTNGAPSWLWWLLGALAVGAGIAVPLLIQRRRRAWEAELAAAVTEVVWLARSLVPQLRLSRSPDQVRGGWAVSADRVTAAEDRLTALEATARREQDRTLARTLRDAVRAAQDRIEAVASGAVADPSAELGRVASDLEAALAAASPSSGQATGHPL